MRMKRRKTTWAEARQNGRMKATPTLSLQVRQPLLIPALRQRLVKEPGKA
jgi:hypothetical protein